MKNRFVNGNNENVMHFDVSFALNKKNKNVFVQFLSKDELAIRFYPPELPTSDFEHFKAYATYTYWFCNVELQNGYVRFRTSTAQNPATMTTVMLSHSDSEFRSAFLTQF